MVYLFKRSLNFRHRLLLNDKKYHKTIHRSSRNVSIGSQGSSGGGSTYEKIRREAKSNDRGRTLYLGKSRYGTLP